MALPRGEVVNPTDEEILLKLEAMFRTRVPLPVCANEGISLLVIFINRQPTIKYVAKRQRPVVAVIELVKVLEEVILGYTAS